MINFLSFKSLANRKFISLLCVLSISLSLSLFLIVEKVRVGVEEGFSNTISNADLIVGSRSGPLQLLLYTVFHMGSPTNNIRYSSYEKIKSIPSVDWTIPISLGDSYNGYRVVATDDNFYQHFQFHGDKKVHIAQGKWSSELYQVVLGSTVAKKLEHEIGDKIFLSHGIQEESLMDHDNINFVVSGIIKTTGTPIDKSVFISLKSMEAIHIGWETGAPRYDEEIDPARYAEANLKVEQLTSFILRSKNRIALLGLQRFIGDFEDEPLMGIIPAMTLLELWSLLDQLELAFLGISGFVIIIGLMSIVISLYMSLNERRREMAILRSIGFSPLKITGLLLHEALLLSILGGVLGFGFQYLILFSLGPFIEENYGFYIQMTSPSLKEYIVVGVFIALGALSGLIPAIKAYRNSLHEGLLVK